MTKMVPLDYLSGMNDGRDVDLGSVHVIGKVRPWDDLDDEYIAYGDGDYYSVQLTPEQAASRNLQKGQMR